MQTRIQILGYYFFCFVFLKRLQTTGSSFVEENKQVVRATSILLLVGSLVESQYRTTFLRLSLLPLLVLGWLENYLDSRIKHRFYILLKED